MNHDLNVQGIFTTEHWRAGKLLRRVVSHNNITALGKAYMLNAAFQNPTSANEMFHVGILSTTFAADNVNDTLPDITGFEFGQYDVPATPAGRRAEWLTDGSGLEDDAGQKFRFIRNDTFMQYDIQGIAIPPTNILGIFVSTELNIGSFPGGETLWATGAFEGGFLEVNNLDILRIQYKVRVPYDDPDTVL